MCVVFRIIFPSILQFGYVEVRISRSISASPLKFEITRVDCNYHHNLEEDTSANHIHPSFPQLKWNTTNIRIWTGPYICSQHSLHSRLQENCCLLYTICSLTSRLCSHPQILFCSMQPRQRKASDQSRKAWKNGVLQYIREIIIKRSQLCQIVLLPSEKGIYSKRKATDPLSEILYFITKTCLYTSDPLKPHFYTVKLGFTGVYIICLISDQKHRLWVLVRTVSASTNNLCFEQKYEKYQFFFSENSQFLEVKFSIYLNRRVFIFFVSFFYFFDKTYVLSTYKKHHVFRREISKISIIFRSKKKIGRF